MKRQAEFQIAKDDEERPEENEPGRGFQRARPEELVKRQIRALPNRQKIHVGPGLGAPSTGSPSPLSAFALMPASAAEHTGQEDSSTAEPSPLIATTPASTNIPPDTSPTSGTLLPQNQFKFVPIASTATSTSKSIASLLGPQTSAELPSTSDGLNPKEEKLFNYYVGIRSLNKSFFKAVSERLARDEFAELWDSFSQYNTHLDGIRKDLDPVNSSNSSSTSSEESPNPLDNSKSMILVSSAKDLTRTPDSSERVVSERSGSGMTTTHSSSLALGAPLALTGTPDVSPSTSNSALGNAEKTMITSSSLGNTSSLTSIFGYPANTGFGSSNAINSSTGSSAFAAPVFGNLYNAPPAFATSSSQNMVFGKQTDSASSLASVPSGNKAIESSTPLSSPAPNLFGNLNKTPLAFPPASSSPKDSSPSIVFGSTPLAFPSTSSSLKNSSSNLVFGATSDATKSHAPKDEPTSEETSEPPAAESTDGEDQEAKKPFSLIAQNNPHDEEGLGEENEETLHQVRSKLYRLTKRIGEDAATWASLGVGILRVKKDKDSGARRVLLRNSQSGKIILNSSIYSGLKPTQTRTSLSFVGHEDGVSQMYTVRTSTEHDAGELKGILEREVAIIAAKEGK